MTPTAHPDGKPAVPPTPTLIIDYDVAGRCILCHRNLQVEKMIGGKVTLAFIGEAREEKFLLSDGSRMRVNVCLKCKDSITPETFPKIMAAVAKGWELEVGYFEHWLEEKKQHYIARQKSLEIVTKTLDLAPDTLQRKLDEFLKNKKKVK